ncbi:MAG: phosphatase PAP2 family protein [Deltaproteobacteria bacterium]|nr:phosphatase PAP2 family protein [Deltaproteobacteria bacterium]
MKGTQKPFVVIISIAALVVFFLQLDWLVTGRVPQIPSIQAMAQFFSFVGDGAFLLGIAALLFLSGWSSKKKGLKDSGKESALAVALGGVAVHILKAAFERPRIAHGGADSVVRLLENPSIFDLTGRYNSFPSGHATAAFAVAYVLSKRYPRLAIPLDITAMLVSAARVWLGSHYPTDVLAGAFLGISAGYLVVTKTRAREKWLIAGLGLLVIFISFFKTGGFLLFDVDEAVFSEASREMLETGDFITPTYNYEPRYDKPILIYWFMTAAFKLFGVTEFAARFTSSIFGVFLSSMTFLFVRRLKGTLAATFATLALILNIEFFIYSHSAVTDMTLAFFLSAALFSFYLANEGDGRFRVFFWIASALAVLTKGAIGILFPVTIALLYLWLRGELKKSTQFLKPAHIGLFFLIAAPWFIVEFAINGWEFFNAFIVKHHIQRYSDVISSHGGPLYYYLGVLLAAFFPWVAMLPTSLYWGFKERLKGDKSLNLFLSVWFVFVLVFFSIARTKLPNYIFPLFPAAGMLAGLKVADLVEGKGRKISVYLLIIIAALFSAALLALPAMGIKMDVQLPDWHFYFLGLLFLAIAALGALSLVKPVRAFIAIAGGAAALIIFLRIYAMPPLNSHLQKTLFEYARYSRMLDKDSTVAAYGINKPSLAFYARRKVQKLEKDNLCNLKEYAKKGDILVITTPKSYEGAEELKALDVIDSRPDYMLVGRISPRLPRFE